MTAIIRAGLAVLLLDELVVGLWNAIWPAGFYRHFPTVDLTPPYSEHYARDFGGATLGIALLLAIALVRPRKEYVVPAALAFSVFAVPHFVFHLGHLHGATRFQAVALTTANAAVALIGLALVALVVAQERRSRAPLTHLGPARRRRS